MTARTSRVTIDAMTEVRKLKRTPYDIALAFGIEPSTLYRSRLYKEFKKECEQNNIELPLATLEGHARKGAPRKARVAKGA